MSNRREGVGGGGEGVRGGRGGHVPRGETRIRAQSRLSHAAHVGPVEGRPGQQHVPGGERNNIRQRVRFNFWEGKGFFYYTSKLLTYCSSKLLYCSSDIDLHKKLACIKVGQTVVRIDLL